MTFERLSEVSGISIAALKNYAAGRIPESPMIARLAAALEVDEVTLFQTPSPATPRPTPAQAIEVLKDALVQKNVEVLQLRGFAKVQGQEKGEILSPDLVTRLAALPPDRRRLAQKQFSDVLAGLEERSPPEDPKPPQSRAKAGTSKS